MFRYDSNGNKIDELEEVKKALNEMAENNRTINDIFKPSGNGFLGEGSFGVMYKGSSIH